MSIKILLLQARNPGDLAKVEELNSFANKAKLQAEQFVPYDLLAGPPSLRKVRSFDAIMIGGSGEYYVSEQNIPHFSATLDFLRNIVTLGHPMFGSCFGFQLLVKALGGELIYDADRMEVGTYELMLTEAGRVDELLGYLPPVFKAQLGRKDKAERLPPNCIHLASSTNCKYQAFRIPQKPIWATQFHPELSGDENLARFKRYLGGYTAHMSEEEKKETLSRFVESAETLALIPRFLELVFS